MLGDDDCLLDGYFTFCMSLLNQYKFPDMIYNSALNYVYPGVMPGAPQGYLMKWGYASFLVDKQTPAILDRSEAHRLVNEILSFNLSVNFNMQHSLVSRNLITKMLSYGKFYQSPYPDLLCYHRFTIEGRTDSYRSFSYGGYWSYSQVFWLLLL